MKKNVLVDWIEAFFWAAGYVLLINQYLFQAYQIPSGSMIDTLLIRDKIIVNKLVYGPELLPGIGKLPSPFTPQRNDVIIFENPSYTSRGLAFDVAQRVIFMLTLSFVDIDKDEWGQPRAHFLIKRAVAMPGDRVFNRNGEMHFRFAGEDRAVTEREYNSRRGWKHTIRRLAGDAEYRTLEVAAKADLWLRLGLDAPKNLQPAPYAEMPERADNITFETERYAAFRNAFPQEDRYTKQYYRKKLGWYVPQGRVLPLGDNRDSSLDGRFFGAVSAHKILGKGAFVFWPGMPTEDGGPASPPLDPAPAKTRMQHLGIIE